VSEKKGFTTTTKNCGFCGILEEVCVVVHLRHKQILKPPRACEELAAKMGKSRKQQQQRRGAGTRVDEYTDDDTLSSTTTSSSLDALSDISITPEVEEEHDDATKLESFIEALYQKR
jgi:hypothetical protein